MNQTTTAERRTDYGPPHYEKFLPPVIKKNYGQWKHHEILKPGVMVHEAKSGDKVFTVRAASGRLLSVDKIRMYDDARDGVEVEQLRLNDDQLLHLVDVTVVEKAHDRIV